MSSPSEPRALLLDWGIGGLSVYRALHRACPDLPVIYLSDAGFTPYGKLPTPALAARVQQLIDAAQARHAVTRVLIACNAASTVIPSIVSALPVQGVIEAGIALLRESGHRRVGVIGGQRTIEARLFSTALPALHVQEQVAQPLSALVERGVLEGPEVERALQAVLPPLAGVEALLLACTHYPALAPAIARQLPVPLLDPAERAAEALVAAVGALPPRSTADRFFTTGSTVDSSRAARQAFGVEAAFERRDG